MDKYDKGRTFIPEEVIRLAVQGDEVAINKILGHYRGYIDKLSKKTIEDDFGNTYFVEDPYAKGLLERQLIIAILKFKIR